MLKERELISLVNHLWSDFKLTDPCHAMGDSKYTANNSRQFRKTS